MLVKSLELGNEFSFSPTVRKGKLRKKLSFYHDPHIPLYFQQVNEPFTYFLFPFPVSSRTGEVGSFIPWRHALGMSKAALISSSLEATVLCKTKKCMWRITIIFTGNLGVNIVVIISYLSHTSRPSFHLPNKQPEALAKRTCKRDIRK